MAEKPYQCEACGAQFAHRASVKIHMRTHTGEKPYQCTTCCRRFARSCGLKKHVRTHTGEKPYRCETCSIGFADKSGLRNHIRTHTGEKPFKCKICGAQFTQNSTLQDHVRTHTGEKPYQCTTCGARFAHSKSLRNHVRTHTGEKPYQCTTCGTGFAQSQNLKVHMRTHTGEKPYQCTTCGRGFAERAHLKRHIRSQHQTGEKPKPHHTTSVSREQPESKLEEYTRTPADETPCHGEMCDTDSIQGGNEEVHLRTTQTEEKQYHCATCGMRFVNNSTLKIHMKMLSHNKPHNCSRCGKEFTHTDNLDSYVRNDTDEQPYQCTACFKKEDDQCHTSVTTELCVADLMVSEDHFNENVKSLDCLKSEEADTNLGVQDCTLTNVKEVSVCVKSEEQDILITAMPKVKSYVCTICGSKFSSMDLFDIHMISHRDEKPCKCISCGAVFELPQNIYDRSHTVEQSYQCPVCGTGSTEAHTQLDKDVAKMNSMSLTMIYDQHATDLKSVTLCIQSEKPDVKPLGDPITMVTNVDMSVCVKSEEQDTCVTTDPVISLFKCISCAEEFEDVVTFDVHVKSHTAAQ